MENGSLLQCISGLEPEEVTLGRGEMLFRQGDPGDDFFVVTSGRLRAVYDLGGENQRIVGEIGRGEPVGETAVIGKGTRGASVVAIRHTELLRISEENYQRLRTEHPGELVELLSVIAQRMKRSYESGTEIPLLSCIAIVPTNGEAPLDEYCERFTAAMKASGRDCALLSSRDLPDVLNKADAKPVEIARWLNERESALDTAVVQADPELTPWTMRCLRHADLVLLLGKVGSDPTPGPLEAALDEFSDPISRPRVDLVLLQEKPPYSGSAEWLEPRQISQHHHVRLDSDADRARLQRLICREDLTIVLGGGGARGLAHIGVVRACEELGLPIDRIGGTSIGSLIGGWAARGAGWKDIVEAMREHFPSGSAMRGRTIPAVSIDTGQRYVGAILAMFGDTQIEDLPINYFAVSCNVSRAKVVAHRSGNMVNWVLTSMSVPGIAPPYVLDGDLLVDGGVLNNLPVDIARADGAGRVIGINVSPEIDLTYPAEFNGRPSNREVLRSWIPGGGRNHPRSPGLFALLNRVSTLSSTSNAESNRHHADLVIKMPVSGYKMFDWEKIDELVELGYREAMEQLKPFATSSRI